MQIIVLAVHLNYETAHRYMKSIVKTNLRSMQVTQERTRHTAAILENVQDNDSVSLIVSTCINSSTRWDDILLVYRLQTLTTNGKQSVSFFSNTKPFFWTKENGKQITGPMEVPPSRSPDRHEDCARRHSLSTINLFSFIPVRLSLPASLMSLH